MVSIIVPVYNTEDYLSRCIESIQKQTMQDIEIILVDDGSTDSSGAICDWYAEKDKRIRVIHQDNYGQVVARNAGISVAGGEYIGFVDSDDWIEENMMAALYRNAVANAADIVMEGMAEEVAETVYPCRNALPAGVYRTDADRAYLLKNMISCGDYCQLGIQPYLWNKLFRSELVKKVLPAIDTKIRIGEDAAAVYSILYKAGCIVILSSYHYHYCLHASSIMMRGIDEKAEWESCRMLCQYLENLFLKNEKEMYFAEGISRYVVNNLLTRVYSRFALLKQDSILFPFEGIRSGDTLIIYGAGAFGRAVYRYASRCADITLKGWADGNYGKYQQLGIQVIDIDSIEIGKNDKIIVAVFSGKAFGQIKESLLLKGINEERILGVSIDSTEERKMLNVLCGEAGLAGVRND